MNFLVFVLMVAVMFFAYRFYKTKDVKKTFYVEEVRAFALRVSEKTKKTIDQVKRQQDSNEES